MDKLNTIIVWESKMYRIVYINDETRIDKFCLERKTIDLIGNDSWVFAGETSFDSLIQNLGEYHLNLILEEHKQKQKEK